MKTKFFYAIGIWALTVISTVAGAAPTITSPPNGTDATSSTDGSGGSSDPFVKEWKGFKFVHPGILSSAKDLAFIKEQIKNNVDPWAYEFSGMVNPSKPPSSYVPKPHKYPCSGFSNRSSKNCDSSTYDDQQADANTAYNFALVAALSSDAATSKAYATAAENILDKWASVFEADTGPNWYLDAAFVGPVWAEGAEILLTADPKWAGAKNFGQMLNDKILPYLHNRIAYGNRGFAVFHTMVAIGVYNNDAAAFAEGITDWKNYVDAYYYLEGDKYDGIAEPLPMNYFVATVRPTDEELYEIQGATSVNKWEDANGFTSYVKLAAEIDTNTKNPIDPLPGGTLFGGDDAGIAKALSPTWDPAKDWTASPGYGTPVYYPVGHYVSGYSAEFGRDLGHAQAALVSTINVAEVAYHQGIDLYTPNEKRLTTSLELLSGYLLGNKPSPLAYNGILYSQNFGDSFEMVYNHYHNILKVSLPNTLQLNTIMRNVGFQMGSYTSSGKNCQDDWAWLPSPIICIFQMTTYNKPHGTPTVYNPLPSIGSTFPATASKTGVIPITVTFTKPVTGFSLSGVDVTNGKASNLKAVSATEYTLDVTPDAGAVVVSVSVKAGAALGPIGKGYPGPNYSVNSIELNFAYMFGRVAIPQTLKILTHGDLNSKSLTD